MNSTKIEPKYRSTLNPRVGLIALATDFRIEKDFMSIIKNQSIDFFVNRIHCYFPLTNENLKKLESTVSLLVSKIGQGRAIMFSDNPNFRGAWYGTNRLFLNAILLGDKITIP